MLSACLLTLRLLCHPEVIEGGDVLLQDGLVKQVSRKTGKIEVGKNVEVIDVAGKWVTPGIVDLHSHMVRVRSASSPSNRLRPDLRPLDLTGCRRRSWSRWKL